MRAELIQLAVTIVCVAPLLYALRRRRQREQARAVDPYPYPSRMLSEAEARPVELPIDGVLDLHTFAPRDVRTLVPDWLDACRARGIHEVRIIHGKGRGTLRRTVHALLARRPDVIAYRLAPAERGGYGATIVTLRPRG